MSLVRLHGGENIWMRTLCSMSGASDTRDWSGKGRRHPWRHPCKHRHRQEGARRQNGIGQLAWPKKRGILVTKLEIYSMGPNHGRSYI